jgi:hypothetical protein
MLRFNEHRPGERNAEADAAQAWMNRQSKKQEKLERRRREAELFARKRRMMQGCIKATDEYAD